MKRSFSKYTEAWFARGDEDLKTAKDLLAIGGVPNTICFHAQQAGEKYLKGFLSHHEKHVRKIHDLEALLEACMIMDEKFSVLRNEASILSDMYTESRYPDDYIEFTKENAKVAFAAALRIKKFLLQKLNQKSHISQYA